MNMILKNKLFVIITILMTLTSIFSQENNVKDEKNNSNSGIILKIELANPKIFHQNDEIYINVKIFNSSKVDKACLIADDKRFSFDFQMVTMQNRLIEHSKDYIISFHRVQPIFNSLVRLAPAEAYVYQIRLNDYFELDRIGHFFVKCKSIDDPKYGVGKKIAQDTYLKGHIRHFFSLDYMHKKGCRFSIKDISASQGFYNNEPSCFIEGRFRK